MNDRLNEYAAPTVKAEQVPDDQAYDRNAERLTAEALGTGSGINMAATSIDELFDEPAPSLPAAGSAVETTGEQRYRVEPRGKGFWPYCVKAGNGERELYFGHKKDCDRVSAELATAFEDGKYIAALSAQQSAPDRVSVPRELLADLISSDHDTKIQAERALYALLAIHAEGGKV